MCMEWTGAEIKRRRKARRWRQADLAAAVGSSLRAVIDWEQDKTAPQGRFRRGLDRELGDSAVPLGPAEVLLREATWDQVVERLRKLHEEAGG